VNPCHFPEFLALAPGQRMALAARIHLIFIRNQRIGPQG
jgi:hypothetical protein